MRMTRERAEKLRNRYNYGETLTPAERVELAQAWLDTQQEIEQAGRPTTCEECEYYKYWKYRYAQRFKIPEG